MALDAPAYLAQARPAELLARLGGARPGPLAPSPGEHAPSLAEAFAAALLPAGALNPMPTLLDLRASAGLGTAVDAALRARGLRPRLFLMERAPAALEAAAEGAPRAVPFLGVPEDLEGSVREARALQPLPGLFDCAFGLGALAGAEPEKFFQGLARVLAFGAPVALAEPDAPALAAQAAERFEDVHVRAVGPYAVVAARR